ncbi:DUF3000 domain-containing protein [Actinoallomurus iriomotensis]|jgi:Protein of unknown function (DUF3000)|uniref:DUF3000 domain-containing protein n=1 Tax=Actinoallomurus iriomotensis TaxID=478107 RepID=A0A9W6RMH2_9ACTN|nr:DUF3000 domain-containing protein [Actinoallomurus iriomotensis]GLY78209.1 hypothetical protein Airi01_064760 [Actinoallomurus iriomotensis]
MTPRDARPPEPFRRAVETMRAFVEAEPARSELVIEDMPAPQRLAPYAAAIMATVYREDDSELGVGRLILLYDPEGQRGWHGDFRVVAYVRADLEPEIAADPLIGPVGWSWLTEALDQRGAGYKAASGTITRAVSESFGDKNDDPETTELELRASWSPTDGDMSGHINAWCDVLCLAAGLPPAGVTSLPGPGV